MNTSDNTSASLGTTSTTYSYDIPGELVGSTRRIQNVKDLRERIENRKIQVLNEIDLMIQNDIEDEKDAINIIAKLINKFKINPKNLTSKLLIDKL